MQAQTVTILDASTGRRIAGRLIKRYERGVTIEDAREIRYYAILERVIDGLTAPQPAALAIPLAPGNNGNLWQ